MPDFKPAGDPEEGLDASGYMRKVDYASVILTTDGRAARIEIRVTRKEGRPLPVTTLARLSQGKMMGVSFNEDGTWVGSSACLWPAEHPRRA